MPSSLNIPKYTSKDIPILVASMVPMAVLLNYFLYGNRYFQNGGMFLGVTLVTFLLLALAFLTYGLVAISLRSRFPEDEQVFKRLGICISIFFLMSAVYMSLILIVYDSVHFFGYQYSENDFTRCYFSFIVTNVFLTFLNEGVYRFERYRNTTKETEQLKKEYMQSQLLGLKSQLNPHFLFNSLNTLSSLIHEDADTAEDFLDHMSKVYRYLLRNNEEQLVTIDTELAFTRSYFFLLKARHADALQLDIDVPEACRDCRIPPMTLQMILEYILNQNSLSRDKPLFITIGVNDEALEVRHNVQPRIKNVEPHGEVLENITNKYRLLCQQEVMIEFGSGAWVMKLPLITPKETLVA
jgi:sensor histidine kinase YesM